MIWEVKAFDQPSMVSWGGDSTAPRKRKPVPSAVDETSAITYLTEE